MSAAQNREQTVRALIAALDDYLSRFNGPGVADVRAGIGRFRGGPVREKAPHGIAAVDHVDVALDWMTANGEAPLAGAIRAAMPYLDWRAYDPYPREIIGETYATNHCATILIGEHGLIQAEDFDLGLFGFGPNILYRDHKHAAPELYAPFTGPNGWRFQPGDPLDWRPAHEPVWNEAWAPHAFRSGNVPFLCVYGWTKDVNIPAEMILCDDWAAVEAENQPLSA
ncbi:hypothetical protein M2360_004280 [Rhizobium sp. SG_E_25_P2]|uniref:dimethylsulfonioproprionate lyase family protein n=1 Tax=Rhizobium sp. SG_E_25_P2 TaxID=2879942 RepID=UPI002472F2ED|nr:dimethylsulfonioproprionate lyase family protein [Rhizobium sp. SG_E_25_P2]MDH6268861.1 hypothetical protein [Rhizobium sp. SG_E_25_P2]